MISWLAMHPCMPWTCITTAMQRGCISVPCMHEHVLYMNAPMQIAARQVHFEPESLPAVIIGSAGTLDYTGDLLVVAVNEDDLEVKGEIDCCAESAVASSNCAGWEGGTAFWEWEQ